MSAEPNRRHDCEIAVIGAGVIGLAIARRLALEGRDVAVIDPSEPGSGASYGNAGTIADYAVQPVGTPDVLKNLPALLFDRNSPLAIRRAAILSLAPWLVRFALQALPRAAERNARHLARLLADAGPRWRTLAGEIGGTRLLRERGCLYAYTSRAARRAAERDLQFRRTLGVSLDLIDAARLSELEPGLPLFEGGAAHFRDAIFLTDPGRMVTLLGQAAEAAGGRIVAARTMSLRREGAGVVLATGAGAIRCRRAVIAAGAHSRLLARQAGDRVPLDTERGYHLEFEGEEHRVTRPVSPPARGFYFCPMAGRLRVAGTVELGGLAAPPSPHRFARLEEGARAFLPDLPAPVRSWMGFRPSLPDSLPAVGPSRAGPEVLHAYGHGHLGLTLAPVTAEIVAAQIAGRRAPDCATGLGPERFR